jgi:hypothetical protein
MKMNSKLTLSGIADYVETLGMEAQRDIQRVNEIFSLGKKLCPERLRVLFISNYRESNGKERFKDLWLFSDNYVIEALNFLMAETPKLEMTVFSQNMSYLTVEAQDYDLSGKAKETSRLRIRFVTFSGFECDCTAFGENCYTLNDIFNNYIKGNLVRKQVVSLL